MNFELTHTPKLKIPDFSPLRMGMNKVRCHFDQREKSYFLFKQIKKTLPFRSAQYSK